MGSNLGGVSKIGSKIAEWNVQAVERIGGKWKLGSTILGASDISVGSANEHIRPWPERKVTRRKPACWHFVCMWKVVVTGQLPASWKSVRKVSRIGSVSMSLNCRLRRCHRNPKWQNWTSCTPFWSRKKQDLCPNHRRSSHSLPSQLGCCQRKKHSQPTSLSGACPASSTILQWCFSSLRQLVLRRSLRNALGQKGDLFSGSSQCRLATLFETTGT